MTLAPADGRADAPWDTSLFGCVQDLPTCLLTFLCPCVVHGNIAGFAAPIATGTDGSQRRLTCRLATLHAEPNSWLTAIDLGAVVSSDGVLSRWLPQVRALVPLLRPGGWCGCGVARLLAARAGPRAARHRRLADPGLLDPLLLPLLRHGSGNLTLL